MAAAGAGGEESRMTLTKVVYRLKKWKHLLGCRVFRAPSEVPLQRCSPYLAQVRWGGGWGVLSCVGWGGVKQ